MLSRGGLGKREMVGGTGHGGHALWEARLVLFEGHGGTQCAEGWGQGASSGRVSGLGPCGD